MDKLKEKKTENEREGKIAKRREGFFSRIGSIFTSAKEARAKDKRALLFDLLFFTVAFLFARCHVMFGSHPLGIAFIAVLPIGVWQATLGAAIGALSLGGDGIIYAVAAAITAFLRVIISGGDKSNPDTPLFNEKLLLRMSSSVIAGFVCAVYEVLLSGFKQTSILFGAAMILLPPLLTFLFSGIFNTGITLTDLIYSNKGIFSLSMKEEGEKYNLIFFQCSALAIIFFITMSLESAELFGISLAYIFISFVTLLIAKRFGALRALAAGFVGSLGISGIYSVSFALAGLLSGALFGFGTGYALIGGGAALSAWGSYTSGLTGLLSTLPEYAIAAILAIPALKNLPAEKTELESSNSERGAQDMVGTMALSYRSRLSRNLDALEVSLARLSTVMRAHSSGRLTLTEEEYETLITECAARQCGSCESLSLCKREGVSPCVKNAENIAKKLAAGERIKAEDINTATEFCAKAEELTESIGRRTAIAERENHRLRGQDTSAEEYELMSKLINEARLADEAEREVDAPLTAALGEIFIKHGFPDGVIRAFGERKKHFIMAGEDESGEKITSPDLRRSIEEQAGIKLGTPEYFRHGKMTLMECDARRSYRVECATACLAADEREVSGDTVHAFESDNECFYSLISDGMGRGGVAKETSEFVSEFLSGILNFGASKETVLHMLNHSLRRRTEECSATVDLFELDLLSGDATFIKSGAAPSYVKRGSSIFRIKSQTAPLGLLASIDTEKIRVEVREGDYVIMLSDGISQSTEESTWLIELLAKTPPKKLGDLAASILSSAKKYSDTHDDMSVIVLKIVSDAA